MRSSLLLVIFFATVQLSPGERIMWTVIGTVGRWHKAGRTDPVTIGTTLQSGDQVEVSRASADTGSLTILAGETPRTFACDDPQSLPDKSNAGCAHPITVPEQVEQPEGALANIFHAIQHRIQGDSSRYYTAASRDAGTLSDAVVKGTPSSVDLRPAFGALVKGSYTLSAAPLKSSHGDTNPSKFTLDWNPDSKESASGPPVPPGLYLLSAQSTDGGSAGEAWILVASPDMYDIKSDRFRAVRKQTDTWNQNVPATTVRAVLHAALDELSQ